MILIETGRKISTKIGLNITAKAMEVRKMNKTDILPEESEYTQMRADLRKKKAARKRLKILAVVLLIALIGAAVLLVWDSHSSYIEFESESLSGVTLEYGEEYQYPEVQAYYRTPILHAKGTPVDVVREGEMDPTHLGTYEITYTAEYKGITNTQTLKIEIVDTVAPVITLVSDPEHFTSPIAAYEEEGFSAIDNYDGDITDKVVSKEENGVVTYTVSDSSGNKATVTRTIVYKDVVPPKISLSGDSRIYVELGGSYKEPGYKATDDCDGDITKKVTVKGSVDTKNKGEYTLEYTVEDSYGNKAKVKRTVLVYEKQAKVPTVNPGDKVVYLTFDDGPGAYTSQLLDVLDKYGVKVTFFVTNQYPSYQKLIAQEAKRGHTVAIHTYSHKYSEVYSSVNAYFKDLEKMSKICETQTGKKPTIIRFPGGTSNAISKNYCKGIMTQLRQEVEVRGYYYCDWNVDSNDAGGARSASAVAENVIAGIKDHKVSVVLQHDIHKYSVEAVDEIIAWGLANGYTFLPLEESSPMVHHRVNN